MTDETTFTHGHDVFTSGEIRTSDVPREIIALAQNLADIHGPVSISLQARGVHIMMADPDLLMEDGEKEFKSKHLAINAELYFRIGRYDYVKHRSDPLVRQIAFKYGLKGDMSKPEVPCCVSMKTGKKYKVRDLLNYPTVEERFPQFAKRAHTVTTGHSELNLVSDENGNRVPAWVGKTVPLHELPEDHPAREYLSLRGFDILELEDQFEACYCTEAAPESKTTGVYYSRLPGGCKNTPKGRIVLTARVDGVRWGYQSRYIDRLDSSGRQMFWTGDEWVLVREYKPDGSVVENFPKSDRYPKGFAPHKYLNAPGCQRNKCLLGFDAAVKFNADREPQDKFCILVEGPFDAGKLGAPAIAILGKEFSEAQCESVRAAFGRGVIGIVPDNDTAGRSALEKMRKRLAGYRVKVVELPAGIKDCGELSRDAARTLRDQFDPTKQ